MKYFFLALLPLIAAFLKVPQKKYQDNTLGIDSSVNIYLVLNCIFGLIFFAALSGWEITPNLPTLLFALVFAGNSIFSSIVNLLAIRAIDIASMAVFSGAGGIILPIIFGAIFLREQSSIFKWIAVILLMIVVLMPIFNKTNRRKRSLKGYIYCLMLFIDSGLSMIVCKLYATNPNVLGDNVFCFWTNVFIIPFTIILIFAMNGIKNFASDMKQINLKTYFFAIATILLGNLVTLLSIFVLDEIPVIVYTILNSSFSLIYAAFFSRVFFKEKITMRIMFSITLSIAAIVFNLF